MTDRHAGYVVTLTENIREDDAQALITAILMIKGVQGVTPVTADVQMLIAEGRARAAAREKIYALLKDFG